MDTLPLRYAGLWSLEADLVRYCVSFRGVAQRPIAWGALTRLDWSKVLAVATEQGVAPFLYAPLAGLKDLAVPGDVLDRLRRTCQITAARNRLSAQAVTELIAAFREARVPLLVLKGVALLNTVYKEAPHLRSFLDIDLLVREPDLARAHGVLTDLGYAPQGDESAVSANMYHLPMYLKAGERVELHFDLVKGHAPFRVALPELWNRARSIPVNGGEMLVFSPEDALLHGALHLSFHKEFVSRTLRQLRDLGEIASKEPVRWDQLRDLASRYRAERSLYYALRLARDLLDAPIAEDVLAALRRQIGRWELALFSQVEDEGGFVTYRDPLRLFLQMLLLQVPAYRGWGRIRFLRNALLHPFRYNLSAAEQIPAEYRVSRFHPWHVLLGLRLLGKGLSIALDTLRRALAIFPSTGRKTSTAAILGPGDGA